MRRIFLVDAYDDEREMYADFLTFSGFDVSMFDAPETVLEAARTIRPDAIITRLSQARSQIDGIALTGRLRADPATSDIPIIVITTSISPADREAATLAGSNAYLLLPATPDVLVAQLRELLGT